VTASALRAEGGASLDDEHIWLHGVRSNVEQTTFHISSTEVLEHYFNEDFFRPPILSTEIIGYIALHILEICQDWRWL
jgi:hypothetical protein